MKKAIYILQEDPRENDPITFYDGRKSMPSITGVICYSLTETCETLLKRMWYVNTDDRAWIFKARRELGPIKAFELCASYWNYCPHYLKKYIDIDKL